MKTIDREKTLQILKLARYKDVKVAAPIELIKIRDRVVLTEGNFITISGLPKSRKTSFLNLFLASAFSKDITSNIQVKVREDENIVMLDTEQSEYDFHRQITFLKHQLGKKKMPKNFHAFLFRPNDPDEILNALIEVITSLNPRLLIIDNLLDIAYNSNDIEEAKRISNLLKKLTFKTRCGIINIIHLNKTNGHTTGNLGSIIDRASQSMLKVEKSEDKTISTLSSIYMRSDVDFEPLSIIMDNDKKHYVETDTPVEEIRNKKKRFSMEEFTNTEIKSIAEITFQHQESFTYAPLVKALKATIGRGDNAIKETVIPYLLMKKYIRAEGGNYTR